MWNKNKQLTIGDLKKLLKDVRDDVPLYVGYGCDVQPLRFLDIHGDGIMFHPNIYEENSSITNLITVVHFSK